MFKKEDRVRHKDEKNFKKYGVMEIWEIKNGYATCRYGDYNNFALITGLLTDIQKAGN